MAKNKIYQGLINTTRWLRLRRAQLTSHPLCERCLASGLTVSATEVHHIVPCEMAHSRDEMERLMYDAGNLRSLCHRCHVAVHTEMGRVSKSRRREITAAQVAEIGRKYFGDDGGTVRSSEEDKG